MPSPASIVSRNLGHPIDVSICKYQHYQSANHLQSLQQSHPTSIYEPRWSATRSASLSCRLKTTIHVRSPFLSHLLLPAQSLLFIDTLSKRQHTGQSRLQQFAICRQRGFPLRRRHGQGQGVQESKGRPCEYNECGPGNRRQVMRRRYLREDYNRDTSSDMKSTPYGMRGRH